MTAWTAPVGEIQQGAGYWYPQNNMTQQFSDQSGTGYQYIGDPQAAIAAQAAGQQLYEQSAPGVWTPIDYNTVTPGTPIFSQIPGGPKPPAGTLLTPPAGTTAAQGTAKGVINTFLANYGLGSLGDTAWQWFLQGQSVDQIMLNVRGTPEYQSRFPAMAQLGKEGRGITETDYINYEKSIAAQNQAAGLPQGMYDTREDIANLLTSNVSPAEYQNRLQAYQTAVWQSPPEVRQALQDYYGVSGGQLTAFFIDPDRALPLIQRDLAASQAEGTSVRTGFGQLGQGTAEHLADLGLSQSALDTGFGNLANQQQLIQGLPGQSPGIGTTTALQAQFDQNAQARQQMEAAQQNQLNLFKKGGGPAATSQGVLGAGSTT